MFRSRLCTRLWKKLAWIQDRGEMLVRKRMALFSVSYAFNLFLHALSLLGGEAPGLPQSQNGSPRWTKKKSSLILETLLATQKYKRQIIQSLHFNAFGKWCTKLSNSTPKPLKCRGCIASLWCSCVVGSTSICVWTFFCPSRAFKQNRKWNQTCMVPGMGH